jgi:hypothetical protein
MENGEKNLRDAPSAYKRINALRALNKAGKTCGRGSQPEYHPGIEEIERQIEHIAVLGSR